MPPNNPKTEIRRIAVASNGQSSTHLTPSQEESRGSLSTEKKEPNAMAETSTSDAPWWYVERYFIYTNELLERNERRANSLMVANSALIVAYFSILGIISNDVLNSKIVELHFREAILSTLPALAFLASVMTAISSSLPKVLDADIPINQGQIAKKSQNDFVEFVQNRSRLTMVNDFVMETHVLTRILEFKSKRVELSARMFLVGALLVPITIALISYI